MVATSMCKRCLKLSRRLQPRRGFSFEAATISAGFNKGMLTGRILNKEVSACGPVEELTADSAERAIDIVAQMDAEPYVPFSDK